VTTNADGSETLVDTTAVCDTGATSDDLTLCGLGALFAPGDSHDAVGVVPCASLSCTGEHVVC
jgi:hypothetical protein